jgi:predicted nucleic acid-binding protein
MMARPVILDTTVMIEALRHPDRLPPLTGAIRFRRAWITSVTVAELYAGTRSAREARVLDRVVDTFARGERLLTPTGEEWRRAGQLVARFIRRYGDVAPRDHLADVLIVILTARLRGTVVTANRRHFERWAELAGRSNHDVTVTPSDSLA